MSTLSVQDVSERFGVGQHTVLGWIRSGELRAINVSRHLASKKPRWRIPESAISAFETLRTTAPPVPRMRRRRRRDEPELEFIH